MTTTMTPWVDGTALDMSLTAAVRIEHLHSAADRLRGVAHRTPMVASRTVDRMTGAAVLFKCENLQRVGAFKFRGAYNAMTRLPDDCAGVLTYSSGNHAQGIALSAAILRRRAVIVMPQHAPRNKRAAAEAYLERAAKGSRVVEYDATEQGREELGTRIAAEEGLTVVPPYDHPHVIAGQGTVALELIEQAAEMDGAPLERLYVCTGGGGVLAGCATACKALTPGCEVIGVEPAAGDDVTRSFRDRVLRTVANPQTIADGARTNFGGRYTLPIIMERVDRMETVSEGRIARAMFLCLERMRQVVEPTGALALAGLLQDAERDPASLGGKRVGVVLTGGNLDLDQIPGLRQVAAGA